MLHLQGFRRKRLIFSQSSAVAASKKPENWRAWLFCDQVVGSLDVFLISHKKSKWRKASYSCGSSQLTVVVRSVYALASGEWTEFYIKQERPSSINDIFMETFFLRWGSGKGGLNSRRASSTHQHFVLRDLINFVHWCIDPNLFAQKKPAAHQLNPRCTIPKKV